MTDYIASPLSRNDIRCIARNVRATFNLDDKHRFPVLEFLEAMPDIFAEKEFAFEIVDDGELPSSVQGVTDVANHHMRIKQSVYDGAYRGSGRDRFSIAHEIAHYLLMSIFGFAFQRNFAGREVKPYEDPEWQADCLAGELLVPYHLVSSWSVEQIANVCGVSVPAAATQKRAFEK